MQHAIESANENGFLGDNILGSGLQFNIEIRRGAGAYICGEETALFNSIEGYRGEPRNKPPFPTQSGLFRQPTAVNNVETLVNVPGIIREGGAAYAKLGTENSAGTRLFCLCGHVARPGVYEIAMGATLRQLIDLAGGVAGSGKLQAVLLGGAAGTFVSPQELDTPLTFEGTRAIGATLGSGVVMLFDDTVDLRHILLRIASFFRHETCGQCVPCRVGVVRQQEALQRLVNAKPLGSAAQEITHAARNGAGHARRLNLRSGPDRLQRAGVRSATLESVFMSEFHRETHRYSMRRSLRFLCRAARSHRPRRSPNAAPSKSKLMANPFQWPRAPPSLTPQRNSALTLRRSAFWKASLPSMSAAFASWSWKVRAHLFRLAHARLNPTCPSRPILSASA